MKFYLKRINPAVCLAILGLCIWAASLDGGRWDEFSIFGMFLGGFGTYFVAKGLFCSSALFGSGLSLLARLYPEPNGGPPRWSRTDIAFVACLSILLAGGFGVLAAHAFALKLGEKATPETHWIHTQAPIEIQLTDLAIIPAAEYFRITGRLVNTAKINWDSVRIDAEILVGTHFADQISLAEQDLQPNESRRITLDSKILLSKSITDSVHYTLKVTATTKPATATK